jgi:hypothetical protein
MNGGHYIDAMPEDIREKWIGNHTSNLIWREHEFDTFRIFISSTLNWTMTNEGHVYWERIFMDIELNTKIEREAKLAELGV